MVQKKPKRRLYIWKSPGDRSRYQLDYVLVKQRFRNSVKDVQTMSGADIDSDHNLLVATICTSLKKIVRIHKRKPRWDLEKLYAQRQEVHDSLEEKLDAIKCESGNMVVQWNNIKKCVLDTMSDLVGKVERRARKPRITQMISEMDELRKWKNVNSEEGRKNYRRQERTETSHGQRQEGISGEHMRRDHRISKKRTL
jgi:endonuclease/exonuclease/phosphatase family metal-dependent hydrolase